MGKPSRTSPETAPSQTRFIEGIMHALFFVLVLLFASSAVVADRTDGAPTAKDEVSVLTQPDTSRPTMGKPISLEPFCCKS